MDGGLMRPLAKAIPSLLGAALAGSVTSAAQHQKFRLPLHRQAKKRLVQVDRPRRRPLALGELDGEVMRSSWHGRKGWHA